MDKEIVIIMGYHASGKSSLVKEFVDQGYHRINRDTTGGSLDQQTLHVEHAVQGGHNKIVLDNTYITIESRESIIALAKKLKIPIRCVWLKTSIEDCQLNACLRMMKTHGKVLGPEELKKTKDPGAFPIHVLFAARKKFTGEDKTLKHKGDQAPRLTEGFSTIEEREFVRVWGPTYNNQAIILDFDGTLRKSIGPKEWPEKPEHVEIIPGCAERLKDWERKGYKLLGASNQSAIAKGLPEADCVACFEQTLKLLGVGIEYQYCPHRIPPFSCYCRKPSTGMPAYFIEKHKLNPAECIFVGDSTSDKTCAARCGMQYQHPNEFFK